MKTRNVLSVISAAATLFFVAVSCEYNPVDPPAEPTEPTVYVAGHQAGVAMLWKNGDAQPLVLEPDGLYSNYSHARSVVVSDGNVYMAGYAQVEIDGMTAVFWNNESGYPLLDDKPLSYEHQGYSVAISGNDAYVAGYEYKF